MNFRRQAAPRATTAPKKPWQPIEGAANVVRITRPPVNAKAIAQRPDYYHPTRLQLGQVCMDEDGEIVVITKPFGLCEMTDGGTKFGYGAKAFGGEEFFYPAGDLTDFESGTKRHLLQVPSRH